MNQIVLFEVRENIIFVRTGPVEFPAVWTYLEMVLRLENVFGYPLFDIRLLNSLYRFITVKTDGKKLLRIKLKRKCVDDFFYLFRDIITMNNEHAPREISLSHVPSSCQDDPPLLNAPLQKTAINVPGMAGGIVSEYAKPLCQLP